MVVTKREMKYTQKDECLYSQTKTEHPAAPSCKQQELIRRQENNYYAIAVELIRGL